ncbi:hypothetical protein PG984_016449 [Apiospora sp. TS-2023a]
MAPELMGSSSLLGNLRELEGFVRSASERWGWGAGRTAGLSDRWDRVAPIRRTSTRNQPMPMSMYDSPSRTRLLLVEVGLWSRQPAPSVRPRNVARLLLLLAACVTHRQRRPVRSTSTPNGAMSFRRILSVRRGNLQDLQAVAQTSVCDRVVSSPAPDFFRVRAMRA